MKSDGTTKRFYDRVSIFPIDVEEGVQNYAIDIDKRLVQVRHVSPDANQGLRFTSLLNRPRGNAFSWSPHVNLRSQVRQVCARFQIERRYIFVAVAGEWSLQTDQVRPTSMPLTALVTTALDQFSCPEESEKCLSKVKAHLRSDAICFRVDSPNVRAVGGMPSGE